jgi:phosphoenolpyruvate phosphomutase
MNERKTVYVPMVADFLHPGHLNILRVASELGEVTVGLFTDQAVASYKRLPFMNYEQRRQVVESVRGVAHVVPQETKDYEPNLRRHKPNYMVHGTDWRQGPLAAVRERAIAVMAEWGGQVVEPEYTAGISSTDLYRHQKGRGVMPEKRLSNFKRLLAVKSPLRVIEAHSGLSALVVESAEYREPGQGPRSFDALWLSSLTDSTVKGKPDIEFVDLTSRLFNVNDILEVTTKPIIYDGDTGSHPEHFALTVKRLERLGVSAVIIEDKIGLKRNSLQEIAERVHVQDSAEKFAHKISVGKRAQMTDDFMIFARIESLILGAGLPDALTRARAYLDAGADGIMIHSRRQDGREILDFCAEYNKFPNRKYLVAVPTNYPSLSEDDLAAAGINVIIYANQLLRSAYTAMNRAALSILEHRRALEADREYIPALDLINLIDGN